MSATEMGDAPGPFFDYVARHEYLTEMRDRYARLCAEDVTRKDMAGARGWAKKYKLEEAKLDALNAWWNDWHNTPARWIGWDGYLSHRR